MSNRHPLYPGVLVDFVGQRWRVVSYLDGGKIWLQDPDDETRHLATLLSELIRTGTVVTAEEPAAPAIANPIALSLEMLRKKNPRLARLAEEYHDDQLEARTGYRLGSPELALPGEPKPEFDPAKKTLDQRLDALSDKFRRFAEMAGQLGEEELSREYARRLGLSTMKRHWTRAFTKGEGFFAFVDGRRLRQRKPLGDLHPLVIAAIQRVWVKELAEGPDIRLMHIRNQTRLELRDDPEAVELKLRVPSRKTFNMYFRRLLATAALSSPTRYRQSRHQMPDAEFDPAIALYPGQFVYIDLVSTNMFAFEEYTYGVVEVRMLVALDAYSATVLAARFIIGEATAGDVVGLILDICFPKQWRPEWGDEAQWRTAGVPDNLVLAFKIDSLILDNALANTGRRVAMAAGKLDINLFFARLAAGEDKARLERFFLTVDDQLWQGLYLGYRGRNPESRGRKPEQSAYFFVRELEDKFWEWAVAHWQPKPHKNIWPDGHPRASLSPNQAFDLGMRKAPPVAVPASRDLLYETMNPTLATIGREGIRFRHFHYLCPDELRPWKGKDAPYSQYGGKWLIFWDPDDRRAIHVQDPLTGRWLHPVARELRRSNIPMSQDDVDYLRHKLIHEQGIPNPTTSDWEEALDEWLTDTLAAARADKRARKKFIKRRLREIESDRLAEALTSGDDEPPPSAPAVVYNEEPLTGELVFGDPALLEQLAAAAAAEEDEPDEGWEDWELEAEEDEDDEEQGEAA